mmetsp:Transcript_6878/g.21496  ORF Transcript_6878/g.21496 Transcript_6878/m.21496 type:complete len:312 (-) Transcript_6878:595-1530(-)
MIRSTSASQCLLLLQVCLLLYISNGQYSQGRPVPMYWEEDDRSDRIADEAVEYYLQQQKAQQEMERIQRLEMQRQQEERDRLIAQEAMRRKQEQANILVEQERMWQMQQQMQHEQEIQAQQEAYYLQQLQQQQQQQQNAGKRRSASATASLDEATAHAEKGTVLMSKGSYAQALQTYDKCLSIQLQHLGDRHPIVAHTVDLMGVALLRLGHAEEALETFEKAVHVFEQADLADDGLLNKPEWALAVMHAGQAYELEAFNQDPEAKDARQSTEALLDKAMELYHKVRCCRRPPREAAAAQLVTASRTPETPP